MICALFDCLAGYNSESPLVYNLSDSVRDWDL